MPNVKAMEIPLTLQAQTIVNRHLAMGYSSVSAVIEELYA